MKLFTEYIALDIGTYSLKFFSVDPGKKAGFKLHTYFHEELPRGLVCGGFTNPTIRSVPEFSKILQEQFAQLSSRKDGVIVGLPDRWVKLHLVELPLKNEEINSKEYVVWRLKKFLYPKGLGDVIVDYQILGKNETAEAVTYKFLVGLVQKQLIDLLSHIFVKLRLQVMAFDTSTLGVYSLIEEFPKQDFPSGNLVLCHIGHETTVIKVFTEGVIQYERVIEVGGEAFCKLLADFSKISFEEAKSKIQSECFFPITRKDLVTLIENRHLFAHMFGNWLRELHVTFRFYQDKFKVQKLPPIFLTGGSSLFQGLPEFLSDFFDSPCRLFNPIASIPWDEPVSETISAFGPMMAPAIGLLVR